MFKYLSMSRFVVLRFSVTVKWKSVYQQCTSITPLRQRSVPQMNAQNWFNIYDISYHTCQILTSPFQRDVTMKTRHVYTGQNTSQQRG